MRRGLSTAAACWFTMAAILLPADPAPGVQETVRLDLYMTNDVSGYLEPCG